MLGEVNGQSFRKWQYEIPNDGVIKFLDMLGSETVVVLGPKALAEVTVHKAYDFIKPPQLRGFLAKILGVGLFLAEGDEHRVMNLMRSFKAEVAYLLISTDTTKTTQSGFRVQTH